MTSFADVVWKEMLRAEEEFWMLAADPDDVVVESMRQNGKLTAVRACHVPTGLVWVVEDEPSFMRARARALANLAAAVRATPGEGKPG